MPECNQEMINNLSHDVMRRMQKAMRREVKSMMTEVQQSCVLKRNKKIGKLKSSDETCAEILKWYSKDFHI